MPSPQPPPPSSVRSWLAAGLVLAAVVLLWFSPWWLGGRVLAPLDILNQFIPPWAEPGAPKTVHNHFPSDAVTQYLPYRMFAEKSYREDGFVGWNNLINGGQAQYANTMGLYFDWTMQLHRWLPFWTAWHLGLMGQFLIAGWGMLWFLRSRGLSPVTSLLGGLAYMGNFQFMAWISHRWALGSFCWMPWFLWAVLRWREKKDRSWALIPIFLALAFLGGSLQHAAFVVIVVACLWAADILRAVADRDRSPQPTPLAKDVPAGRPCREMNGSPTRACLRITSTYLVAGILGFGLAAMMFLPCVQAFLLSRSLGQTRGGLGYLAGEMQPLFNLASYPFFIFPSALGSPQTLDLWKVFKSDLFYLPWFGLLPTLFALLGVFRPRVVPLEARLMILAGLIIPLTPLVGPLYPRVFLVFILGGVWAFAEMWERDFVFHRKWASPTLLAAGMVFAIWLLASFIIFARRQELFRFVQVKMATAGGGSHFANFPDWLDLRAHRLVDSHCIWSLDQWPFVTLTLLGLGLWLWHSRHSSSVSRAGMGLTLVLLVEITLFASRWVTFSDPHTDPAYASNASIEHLRATLGDGRVILAPGDYNHAAFSPNTLMPLGVPTLNGYESITPPTIWLQSGTSLAQSVLTSAGVSHCAALPGSDFWKRLGWPLLWRDERLAVYANPSVPHKYTLHTGDGVSPELPQVLQETQNRRWLEIPSGHWTLRVAENFGDGWQYSLVGAGWEPVRKAPDGSMTIPLPSRPDRFTVALRYQPSIRRQGLFLSAATVMLLILCTMFSPKAFPDLRK